MSYKLPILNYSYDSLEPYIDTETMKIHHTKHHQAYVNNTNTILQGTKFKHLPIFDLLPKLNSINLEHKIMLQNNSGGHANHILFWNGLKVGTVLTDNLKIALKDNFGSIEAFKYKFETLASNHFGSGWIWLVKLNNMLRIVSTVNQNNPLMGVNLAGVEGYPILCLDVWEHAYYLRYKNNRNDYIRSFWSIVNWDEASKRFNNS